MPLISSRLQRMVNGLGSSGQKASSFWTITHKQQTRHTASQFRIEKNVIVIFGDMWADNSRRRFRFDANGTLSLFYGGLWNRFVLDVNASEAARKAQEIVSLPIPQELLGIWVTDPADERSVKNYGQQRWQFTPKGKAKFRLALKQHKHEESNSFRIVPGKIVLSSKFAIPDVTMRFHFEPSGELVMHYMVSSQAAMCARRIWQRLRRKQEH